MPRNNYNHDVRRAIARYTDAYEWLVTDVERRFEPNGVLGVDWEPVVYLTRTPDFVGQRPVLVTPADYRDDPCPDCLPAEYRRIWRNAYFAAQEQVAP